MLSSTTPNREELADLDYRAAERQGRAAADGLESCAGCGFELPTAFRCPKGDSYCGDCERYPRLYASTHAIVAGALRRAAERPSSQRAA